MNAIMNDIMNATEILQLDFELKMAWKRTAIVVKNLKCLLFYYPRSGRPRISNIQIGDVVQENMDLAGNNQLGTSSEMRYPNKFKPLNYCLKLYAKS